MTQISVSELNKNTGKYVTMAREQDVVITQNGKIVAKLTTAKADKKEAWNRLREMFRGVSISDEEVVAAREERLK